MSAPAGSKRPARADNVPTSTARRHVMVAACTVARSSEKALRHALVRHQAPDIAGVQDGSDDRQLVLSAGGQDGSGIGFELSRRKRHHPLVERMLDRSAILVEERA